ncbi:hypothetical protein BD413DRAFT_472030 [Trametes elegans]|nr:hypothetical protein BD413DRAFT_472030 [Trametes elegans]
MESLPQAILQHIFVLACTDGGHTGIALSSTSKTIRTASRTARFDSVHLTANPRRLQLFVTSYEAACASRYQEKPKLRHLFVAFPIISPDAHDRYPRDPSRSLSTSPARTYDEPASASAYLGVEDAYVLEELLRLEVDEAQILSLFPPGHELLRGHEGLTTSPQYLQRIRKFLQSIASDLLSLVVQCGSSSGGDLALPIFERPLPYLRDLTLVGVLNPHTLFPSTTGDARESPQPCFPSVTHLHLIPYGGQTDLRLSMWAAHAPNATHLRVTGQTSLAQLARAVGVRVERDSPVVVRVPGAFCPPSPPPPPPPRTYPSVCALVMQPSPPPRGGFCGTPPVEFGKMVEDLWRFAARCRGVGVDAVVLPPMHHWSHQRLARWARGEWVERVEGGEGCWAPLTDRRAGSLDEDMSE